MSTEKVKNKQITLKDYVTGYPKEEDLLLVSSDLELKVPTGSNAVLVKNLYISCDPYMRGKMSKPVVKSYTDAYTPGSMELTGDSAKYLSITLKYGGYWAPIKNQVRKKYASGKQKTMKFQKDLLSYQVLKDQFESICPWLKGQNFEVFSHICGTSPKEYMAIKSNVEVMELIEQCSRSGRAEVVVITEDVNEIEICSQDQQIVEDNIMLGYDSTSKMVFNENIEFGVQQELVVGARFHDSMSFKQALRTNSIMNNFGVKIQASNKTRVIAICMHQGCPWRVRASLCKDGQSFEVRRLEPTHLCPGVNRAGNRQATVSWVAQEIADIIKRDPDIPPRQINNTLESSYGLSLPYMKLWRSREVARDSLFGSVDESYRWVPSLQAELVKRNPGSHIIYTCSKKDHSFKRFFVSFKSLIDGFLVGCRPLIGLDACHLKSKYLGVLLSANSLDGNNGLYTIAFAVAESESKKTWKWFLENLALSIGRRHRRGELVPYAEEYIRDITTRKDQFIIRQSTTKEEKNQKFFRKHSKETKKCTQVWTLWPMGSSQDKLQKSTQHNRFKPDRSRAH